MTTYTTTTYSDASANEGTSVSDVNDEGQVVGTYNINHNISGVAAQQLGYLYEDGSFTTILDPDSSNTQATAINDEGQIIGLITTGVEGQYVGFLYSGGSYTTIADPSAGAGLRTFASAINNNGVIVGEYDNGLKFVGYTYSNGVYTDLVNPLAVNGGDTDASAINDSGQIVGTYFTNTSSGAALGRGAFFYSNGVWTDLVDPSAPAGALYDGVGLNNSGEVIAWYDPRNGGPTVGFTYQNGVYTDLHDPNASGDGFGTTPSSINDSGQIVGYYETGSGSSLTESGFVDDNGTYTDIPSPGGLGAVVINNDGDIALNDEVLTPNPDLFNGASSLAWTDSGNWSGGVAETNDYVTIAQNEAQLTGVGGTVHDLLVEAGAQLDIEDAGDLSTIADLDNQGMVTIGRDNDLYAPGLSIGGILNNSATFEVGTPNDSLAANVAVSAGGLNNSATIFVAGGASAQALLSVAGSAGFGTQGVLSGVVLVYFDAQILFSTGSITSIAKNASLTLQGESAQINAQDNGEDNSALQNLEQNAGTLSLLDGPSLQINGDLLNTGIIVLDSNNGEVGGTTFQVDGALTNDDILDVGNPELSSRDVLSAGSLTNSSGAQIYVEGEVGARSNAVLVVNGAVSWSGSPSSFVVEDGAANLQGAVSGGGSIMLASDASLELGASDADQIDFSGYGNELQLDDPSAFKGSIEGLAAGDQIDDTATPIVRVKFVASGASGGALDLINSAGATVGALALEGVYATQDFNVTTNFFGGSIISLLPGITANLAAIAAPQIEANPGYQVEIDDTLADVKADGNRVAALMASGHVSALIATNISGQAYVAYDHRYDIYGQLIDTTLTYAATSEPFSSYATVTASGGDYIGTDFFYTAVASKSYAAEEVDDDGAGRVKRAAFSGVNGAAYSSYEYDYVGGIYAGARFTITNVPAGATYTSYQTDYGATNAFAGDSFTFVNISGASYSSEEEDLGASGKLARLVFSGYSGEPYASLELDYNSGVYAGEKVFTADISGEPFKGEEVDVSAAGKVTKAVYSGYATTPYSSVEEDFSGGALSGVIYDFTGIAGKKYDSYQVAENASGVAQTETLDLASGGHQIIAKAPGQTLTSLGDDVMTGDGATKFVFDAIYGADVITNFTSADKISLPSSEFTSLSSMLASHAKASQGNVVITAADGDSLTIDNTSIAALSKLTADFSFP